METRLEAMEQQVFKCQGMVERGLNANHMMITEFTSNHKMDAIDIGKHLSRLYDRVDQLQGQIYDLQNQNLLQHPQSIKMSEGMLHIRDVEGPKKTGSVETRLEAMEQQVFKCQGMVERGLNANHMMITEFTSNHKMDAIDIGKHLSRLYDRVDQLQGQIYDLQNQNCEMVWLLNDVYDAEHRAYFMSEKKMELTPLKIRSHGASSEPEVEDGGKKDRVPAGATFTWIAANFAHCPEDADDEVIQRYARVYMWYVISRTIFADGTGKNAPWMWLKALTVLDNKFSWGSAALAYLYRQLDDACRRTTKDGGVGGCMLLLSVWSWERLPVGRPKSSKWNTWDDPTTLYGNLHGLTSGTWLDRRRQRKIKDWQKHHKSYVLMFEQSVQATSSIQRTQYRQHCALAFSNYLRWFQESTRVEICPPAYEEDILEEPTEYDELAQGGYSKLIREGYQTSFAPVLNFVRKEVKKQAHESEDILDNTPGGKKGESALRLFIKEQGKKLRHLSNILGCRDPEYVSPSRSGSSERNTLDDSASSGARMDYGDITQRNTQEDDVDTPQAEDDMTLKAFQRSAYMLKPRKEFKRYSPDDYAKGKNPVAESSRLSRMRSREDEVEDDDDDESDDPDQFVVARRKKLVSKRGRGPK
ncbi:mutator protein [Hordeum vulgare]|nr:mutator protein [Hordeum vulgare]